MDINNIKKIMVMQQGESDCGAACLQTIIQYYGGYTSLERLRELCGTQRTGTTLLGLYQAANASGFKSEGCEADIDALIKHPSPIILHVEVQEGLEHYVVCFSSITKDNTHKFIIGDPAKGVSWISEHDLNYIWKSKTCLTLEPNNKFIFLKSIKEEKKAWFRILIEEDKPLLAITVGMGIAIAVLGITMAVFSQKLIDDLLPKKAYANLYLGSALVFLILIIKEELGYLRSYILLRQSKDFNNRITNKFYTHLLKLPKSFFDTRKTGELVARLNDTSRIQNVIVQLVGNTIINSLIALITVSFLFIYSWSVALFCIIVLPFYFWLIYKFNQPILTGQRKIMSSYAMSEANYISSLQGIEPIRNHNKIELFKTINRAIYENYQINIFNLGKLRIRISFFGNAFGALFLISIIVYCSFNVMHGHLKVGELMAILGMSSTLLPAVANLALVTIPINEAKIAFDRMYEFMGVKPESSEGITIDKFKKIELKNISFRFAGQSTLLKGVSLEVKKGEVIGLMGENGSGKSTVGQIILRSYQAESGNILINDDIDLNDISLFNWRKIIGIVPQNIHIFNGTVLENIAFEDIQTDPEKIITFLKEYGFDSYLKSLPQSYATIVGEEGINLSGGQKQIIALARALYYMPQLLILDEANAALDRESEEFFVKLLGKIKLKMAVLFITHKLQILRTICDRIYVIDRGVVCHSGNHKSLLQTENLYSNYWKDFTDIG